MGRSSHFHFPCDLHNPYARASARVLAELAHEKLGLPTPYVGWIGKIEAHLKEAVEDGDLSSDLDTREVAWILIAAFHGAKSVTETLLDLHAFPHRAGAVVARLLSAYGAVNALRVLDGVYAAQAA